MLVVGQVVHVPIINSFVLMSIACAQEGPCVRVCMHVCICCVGSNVEFPRREGERDCTVAVYWPLTQV